MKKIIFVIISTFIMLTGCTNKPEETPASAEESVPSTALASCEYDGYVYYVTLGDEEGIHKMLPDGSEDTIICGLEDIPIDGSTAVTAESGENGIIFSVQKLSQIDENGKASEPEEILNYKLDLSDNSLKKM
ncbi:hypothetical protein IMSAG049_00391 [Clostridiales bacterium]|nr:hypothetical protein IMSAG049_00391 [Clostridiales bacterium]